MCGRFTSTTDIKDLADVYQVDEIKTDPAPKRYNVAPTQQVFAVATSHSKAEPEALVRRLGEFKWGLVPSWAKDPSVGNRMINARSEGIASKPAYRSALLRRRCVIPADAFYEWQRRPAGADGKKRSKLPWAIERVDGRPLSFAGLWEVWRDPDQADPEPLRTCVIVTTGANGLMRPIHDRMPVILSDEDLDTWLDPDVQDKDALQSLLKPPPDGLLRAAPVSTRVNDVKNDGPELLEPIEAPPGSRR